MDEILVPSGLSATVAAIVMQGLKNNPKVTFMSRDTPWINRIVAAFFALITAVGISMTYSYDHTTSGFTLVFTGTVSGLIAGAGHWAGQFAGQHLIYKGLAAVEILGEMRALLKAQLGQLPQEKKNVPQQPGVE